MDTSTPEKKSDFAKRVLFGASKKEAAGEKQLGATSTRSGSQSSTCSAPGPAMWAVPSTPKVAASNGVGTPSVQKTPAMGKPSISNNAALSVFLRVRPPGVPDADIDKLTGRRTYQVLEDQATLRTFPPLSAGHSRTINRQAKDFGFTKVFSSEAGQVETYESTMRPLVDDVFAAQNALLFAYGMTNAGKTYTVLGEDDSPGLIPNALTDMFERVAQMEADEPQLHVELSFLEIYIENVYDLLAAADADDWAKARTALKLDNRMGIVQARDLSKHVIRSAAEGLELVRRATANRRVASTRLNEDSSRSHSVCMIKLVREKGKDSSLWVVDLAGSERSGRTGVGASSTRQKEANNINKSLSTLWHCLTIMRANLRKDEPESRVPFRESKLTHLFKNHLQGPAAGKTVMVVNINPSTADFDETQQVLKNSTIARDVKTIKDDSGANRQNGLIHTPYGFNGRKLGGVKKTPASRRSIHQAVAPKLDGLDPPPPRATTAKGAKRAMPGQGDTDCGSDADVEQELEGREDGGYLSGAESDSGLVDTRQSMNLVVRNLQVDNAVLKNKLKNKEISRGHQPIPGGPLEQYICLLEDRVSSAEARMEEMRLDHEAEVQELEDELEDFLAENGLNEEEEGRDARLTSPSTADAGISAAVVQRLQEEVRVANLQADQWKKEAETLRDRLQKEKEPGGTTRSPLRQSTGSTGQGRPSLENIQDGENSPPGHNSGGLPPSKNASRNASPSKIKASVLPGKKKKASTPCPPSGTSTATSSPQKESLSQTVGGEIAAAAAGKQTRKPADAAEAAGSAGSKEGDAARVVRRESRESGGCWGSKGKVVVAVSRRVSVLRVSTAGGRRVSAVRASLASGRRTSRTSYAAGSRRVSQLARSRTSVAAVNAPADSTEDATTIPSTRESEEEGVREGSKGGGIASRRESAILLAVQQEENFFEKARRTVLRVIGVGRKSTLGSSPSGSIRGGTSPMVAETAAEIAQRHKIKVKMPKRPSKKAMDAGGDPAEQEGFDEIEGIEEVDEEAPSPTRLSTSAVMSGIERWVFGGKQQERTTPVRTPPRSKASASASALGEVTPTPGTTTMHDYVRAM